MDWVLDLNTTAGRASAYDCMLMTYWVTMRMVGHSSVVREGKGDRDAEPVHFWKEHNSECYTMHQKIDIIVATLGFSFHSVDRRALECAQARARDSMSGPMDAGVPVGVQNVAAPQHASMASCPSVSPRWGTSPPGHV